VRYSLWYNALTMLPATGRQHRGCIIPQSVTHSLVLLTKGKIIALNMLSWLELLIVLHLVVCLYYLYFITFFWDLLNNFNLTLILKTWRIRWAP